VASSALDDVGPSGPDALPVPLQLSLTFTDELAAGLCVGSKHVVLLSDETAVVTGR